MVLAQKNQHFLQVWKKLVVVVAAAVITGNDVKARKAGPSVPEWAKSAVWYQIFPERFRNGDPANDPQPKDMVGSWPHETSDGWRVSKWTGDWYELQRWEKNDDKGFYYHAQQRRYGGDLQGIIDKLDYLKELGINALYLNPVFESPSLHKYDATYYHHIDNNLGPDPEGDRRIWSSEKPSDPTTWKWTAADKLFLKLVKDAHQRGIKVVIDGVFNHVGMTFWAFEDVQKNQENSEFKDWFTIKKWDDTNTKENEFDYEGWFGVRELPELREDENGLVQGPREHIKEVVQRWMDPNGDGNPQDGIDGWRLDVAEKVSLNFWREFRRWVRGINPEGYLVGEVWWEDWQNEKMFNAAPWLQGDVFDAVMNYRWAREAVRYFAGKNSKISSSEFVRRLESLHRDYPADINYVLLNLFDSHDTDRLGSRIVNADLSYDKHVGTTDNPSYEIRKPTSEEWRVAKLMSLFQMTFVGAPCIYYGDEAGMWGGDDPDCRKPMVWDEMKFQNESHHPFGGKRPDDTDAFDSDLHRWYSLVANYRLAHSSLRTGTIRYLVADDKRDVLAYHREAHNDNVIVVLNDSHDRQEVEITLPSTLAEKKWSLGIGKTEFQVKDGRLRVTLEKKSGLAIHST